MRYVQSLHTEEALDAIDFRPTADGKTHYNYRDNATVSLAECPYFTTNLISLTQPMGKDFTALDSFVLYFCVEGIAAVKSMEHVVPMHAGECVLVPAAADRVELFAKERAKLLEVYIDPAQWKGESGHHTHAGDWLVEFDRGSSL